VVKIMNEHSEEQGLRVHHLVNLGGLVAVAELDREPPDFLLEALVSMDHERDRLTPEQRVRVAALGREKLDERATAKRAWKSWRRSQDLHSLMLNSAQIRRLIEALGGKAPEDSKDLIPTLIGLLRSAGDAVVEAAAR
jgi:CHAD domain-containing protein